MIRKHKVLFAILVLSIIAFSICSPCAQYHLFAGANIEKLINVIVGVSYISFILCGVLIFKDKE